MYTVVYLPRKERYAAFARAEAMAYAASLPTHSGLRGIAGLRGSAPRNPTVTHMLQPKIS